MYFIVGIEQEQGQNGTQDRGDRMIILSNFVIYLELYYSKKMSIIRKNKRASRFSTFREEKGTFMPNQSPHKQPTQISINSKSSQQYDSFSNLENINDQAIPPSRKISPKFFTFLNDFSRKLSTIKDYNASQAETESNDVSIEF